MKVAILGAGKQAQGVLYYLSDAENVESITVADHNETAIRDLVRPYLPDPRIKIAKCNAGSVVELTKVLSGCDTAVSCLPYQYNTNATYAAIKAKCNLVDLGGNTDIVKQQFKFNEAAQEAGVTIIPDCGLAPGFVSILAADAIQHMSSPTSISIKVGGLPNNLLAKTAGPLKYYKVFSLQGLWNEYVQSATILRDGKIKEVEPLTGYERIYFKLRAGQTQELEAFVTSGGISTLPDTYKNIVQNIEYKTLRYPGHYDVICALKELNQLSIENLEKLVRPAKSDVVFGQVKAQARHHTRTYEFEIRPHFSIDYEITISAMAQATAFPATIIAMMLANTPKDVRWSGVLRQENAVNSTVFLKELRKTLPITIEDHIVQKHEI